MREEVPVGRTGPEVDAEADERLSAVAPRLRELRRRSGLTLEAAAARAGLSPAHLSRLETGRRRPSLPVLLALARAHSTTVSDLLGETGGAPGPVIRAADAPERGVGGWTYRRAGAPGRGMQALRVRVPYGEPREDPARIHPGEEWLHVLAGRLRLVLGGTEHLLEPGDGAHFDSLTPHRLGAADRDGVELLFVHTLLQSADTGLCLGDGPVRHRPPGRSAP
ncbi:XRE family transcriptional regulator [Streptomyces calidiresistens]|uniref:Helix-turn-helix domain-containing protein n=1 Tax=Streptomyces calidiresistens TaxID=1485586 RepID=A0A7W3T642_9ACTN|nr:XRE family transcriptional regulator [Streptomyces calidiresistens]MBB0231632.1 helix-turn-helix domain-containing protein [Streptomyces calidiresistens]